MLFCCPFVARTCKKQAILFDIQMIKYNSLN
jgi:hypothetical protein